MKKLLLFIILISSQNVNSQNLVPNPSFENYPATWSTATTSSQNYRMLSGCGITPDTTTIQSWTTLVLSPDRIIQGTAPCYDNDLAQDQIGYLVVGNTESIKSTLLSPLQQNCLYQFSCWLNLETFNGSSTNYSNVSFIFSDPLSNIITSPNIYFNIWQYFATPITAGANATTLEIRNNINNAGLAVDNVQCVLLGCPLSVEFLYVQIKQKTLMWATASEINSDVFEVEYAQDGSNWENIATINAKGFSISYNYYNMKLVRDGYYRVAEVDYDGYKQYSKIVYMRDGKEENSIGKKWNILGQEIK